MRKSKISCTEFNSKLAKMSEVKNRRVAKVAESCEFTDIYFQHYYLKQMYFKNHEESENSKKTMEKPLGLSKLNFFLGIFFRNYKAFFFS